MFMPVNMRKEKDSLGEFQVPATALYGAQTMRAVENFKISGQTLSRQMIAALGMIKHAAAQVNEDLGNIDSKLAKTIRSAAEEVIVGKLDSEFPVDVFQTGSGTSSNMNANEVIANRAIQLLGGEIGSKTPVHPNDHVNFGQSSNDVFPTAIHVAGRLLVAEKLLPALKKLQRGFEDKAKEFDDIVKIGRTHLQDATPIRLGQEFKGFAGQIVLAIGQLEKASEAFCSLAQGGTAVGTGINTHPEFGKRVAAAIAKRTNQPFKETNNHFMAQSTQDVAVQVSGVMKGLAAAMIKIANDIRLMGSGPRLGLGELEIPAVQPGSSIMPGKVNPVIAESMIMLSAQVIANDAAITLGGLYGNFELNVMLPLIARNLHEQIILLANGCEMFCDKLLSGLKANREAIASKNEYSLSLATALAPHIGYDAAADIAKESYRTGRSVREIARERKLMDEKKLESVLDLHRQTEPGIE